MQKIDRTIIETKDFNERSEFADEVKKWFFRNIRPVTKAHLLTDEQRRSYEEQWDNTSRILEIGVESIAKFNHKKILGEAVWRWAKGYMSAQHGKVSNEKTLVYTQHDNQIPFIAEEDVIYWYMMMQSGFFGRVASYETSKENLERMLNGFIELNSYAAKTFHEVPTIMPRFNNHNRLLLKVIQKLDKPTNCCPSGHIANAFYFLSAAEEFLPSNLEMKKSLEYSVKRMMNSVLYTKQHGLVDVFWGMVLAKDIIEKKFNRKFNDLGGSYLNMKRENPEINYDFLYGGYHEAQAILKDKRDFTKSVEYFFKIHGYPLITPEEVTENTYFDLAHKTIIN